MWTIYKHTCPNGKCYIGQTKQKVNYRWSNGRGYKHCPAFYNAINKYGWENIKHEIIEDNIETQEEADEKEIYYIKKFNSLRPNGYNLLKGGKTGSGDYLIIDRTGETNIANNGMKMTIIAYRTYSDIDIQFENGIVVHNRSYNHFLSGKVSCKTDEYYIRKSKINKDGRNMQIINYNSYNNIDIEFEDGTIIKGVDYSRFIKGDIKHPDDKNEVARIGEVVKAKNGLKAKIIKYISSEDITIQFEDGMVVEHIKYDYFLKGWIKHPNIKVGKIDRTGEIVIQNCGLKAKIIKYNSTDNIDIQFENGEILENKSYRAFKIGKYRSEKYDEIVSNICNKYCIAKSLFYKVKLNHLELSDIDIVEYILKNDEYTLAKYTCKNLGVSFRAVDACVHRYNITYKEAIEKQINQENYCATTKIDMYTKDNKYIKTFESLADAEYAMCGDRCRGYIGKLLRKQSNRITAYGYKWCIHNEELVTRDKKTKQCKDYDIHLWDAQGKHIILHNSKEFAEFNNIPMNAACTFLNRLKKSTTDIYKYSLVSLKELSTEQIQLYLIKIENTIIINELKQLCYNNGFDKKSCEKVLNYKRKHPELSNNDILEYYLNKSLVQHSI